MRAILASVKLALQAVGDFNSRLILTLLYIFVVPPFALIAKMGEDSLGLTNFGKKDSLWRPRRPADGDLDSARQQS